MQLQIWDTAGTEQYKAVHSLCYKDANGIVLVYDITNQESFHNLKAFWIKEIRERCGLEKVEMVLIGNKLDKLQKSDRKVSKEQGDKLRADYGMQKFEEMSATSDLNENKPLLEDTLATLTQKMWEKNLGSDEWSAKCVDVKIKQSKDKGSCKC